MSPWPSPFLVSLYFHIHPDSLPVPTSMAIILVRNGISCHNSVQVHIQVPLLGVSRYFADYTWVLPAARLTVSIYRERSKLVIYAIVWYSQSCGCNTDEYDIRNALYLLNLENYYCENMVPSVLQSCTEVSAGLEVTHRSAQQSISKKGNQCSNIDPRYWIFSTFCTYNTSDLFVFFHHASKRSMMLVRHYQISKSRLVIHVCLLSLYLSCWSSTLELVWPSFELCHSFHNDS